MPANTMYYNTKAFRRNILNMIGEKFLTYNGQPTPFKCNPEACYLYTEPIEPMTENNLAPFGCQRYKGPFGAWFSKEFCEEIKSMMKDYVPMHNDYVNTHATKAPLLRFNENVSPADSLNIYFSIYPKQNYRENEFDVYGEMLITDLLRGLSSDGNFVSSITKPIMSCAYDIQNRDFFVSADGLLGKIEKCKTYLFSYLEPRYVKSRLSGMFQNPATYAPLIPDKFRSFYSPVRRSAT